MARKSSGITEIRGHHFYSDILGPHSIVLDLGAYSAEFSLGLSARFGCLCYAVEASPFLYERIEATPLVRKFHYAIAGKNADLEFCCSPNPESNHIKKWPEDEASAILKVPGITLESFLSKEKLQTIDLLKVDIEGAEIDLFNSLHDETLKNIKQITVEFHDFIYPIRPEVEKIKKRLQQLGFIHVIFSRKNHADVLFLNQRWCHFSRMKFFHIAFLLKYSDGFKRLLRRIFTLRLNSVKEAE